MGEALQYSLFVLFFSIYLCYNNSTRVTFTIKLGHERFYSVPFFILLIEFKLLNHSYEMTFNFKRLDEKELLFSKEKIIYGFSALSKLF